MHLKIKPFNNSIKSLYENHGNFHDGDAGIDLFVIEEQTIQPGETTRIHLGIACENIENKPYLLMPRSSISKTPLRQCNSIGLIDAGYRGEIMAAVDNIKDRSFTLETGQRIFQLLIYVDCFFNYISKSGGEITDQILLNTTFQSNIK